jgi:hypothetical protein
MLIKEWAMAKRRERTEEKKVIRPERITLTREESLKRIGEFQKRKGKFIAAIRKGKNRGVSA